jgi:hypothetical protein
VPLYAASQPSGGAHSARRAPTMFLPATLGLALALPCAAVTVYSQVPLRAQTSSSSSASAPPSSTVVRRSVACLLISLIDLARRETRRTRARRPTIRLSSTLRPSRRISHRSSVMLSPRRSPLVPVSSSAAISTVSRSRCPSAIRHVRARLDYGGIMANEILQWGKTRRTSTCRS